MRDNGEIFMLCPYFPREMLISSEVFEDLDIYLDAKFQLLEEERASMISDGDKVGAEHKQ